MDKDLIAARLLAVAGLAKATASDVQNGRLWEGDLDRKISEMYEQLRAIPQERR